MPLSKNNFIVAIAIPFLITGCSGSVSKINVSNKYGTRQQLGATSPLSASSTKSLSVTSGTEKGGTRIVVSGAGYSPNVKIEMWEVCPVYQASIECVRAVIDCPVDSVSENEVVCTTQRFKPTVVDVAITNYPTPYAKWAPTEWLPGAYSYFYELELSPVLNALGYFQFFNDSSLALDSNRLKTVRTNILWENVQPDLNKPFRWKMGHSEEVLRKRSFRIIPTLSLRHRNAVMAPAAADQRVDSVPSSPPKDLNPTPKPGTEIYSQSVYNLVRGIAEHYKGRIETLVIENEMNSDSFWNGTGDEYVRVLRTARQALRDVDSGIRLTDGGIQGNTLVWHLIKKMIDDKIPDNRIIDFYKRAFPKYGCAMTSPISVSCIRDWAASKSVAPGNISHSRTLDLLRLEMWRYVDVANFHYYNGSESLPEVIGFVRNEVARLQPNKALSDVRVLSNEMGVPSVLTTDINEAGRELVKKVAIGLSHWLESINWFSVDSFGVNVGAIVLYDPSKSGAESTTDVAEMRETFTTAFDLLGRRAGKRGFKAEGSLSHAWFVYPEQTVHVYWASVATNVALGSCEAIGRKGYFRQRGGVLQVGGNPVYVVCE